MPKTQQKPHPLRLKEVLLRHTQAQNQLQVQFKKAKIGSVSLSECLGDAYLLIHNPIFRLTREIALERGAKFRPASRNHWAMPLTQLPTILKTGEVPFHSNFNPLVEIEKKMPGVFLWKELVPITKSHHFHESAHWIVSEELRSMKALTHQSDVEKRRLILLQEAFANATETLAQAYAHPGIHDEFLNLNSYIMEPERHRNWIRKSILKIGLPQTFRSLILSYWAANLLVSEPLRKQVRGQPVFKIGLSLDPDFVLHTNAFCLQMAGIPRKVATQPDLKWLQATFEQQRYDRLLWRLSNGFGQ